MSIIKKHVFVVDILLSLLGFACGDQRIGVNHFLVGHIFQNLLAYGKIKPQAWIPWIESPNRPSSWYGGRYSQLSFTNWP